MKTRFIVFVGAWLLSMSAMTPALASEPWGVSVEAADPKCDPERSVSFQASLEFQVGVWAWKPVGSWKMCVNDGGTSEIKVNFRGEPYHAVITINGGHADLAPPAGDSWAFVFTRQDYVTNKPSALPRRESFVLASGKSNTFVMSGKYRLQERNLRLRISR